MSDASSIIVPCRHIILVGLMGCGKTTIGKELQRAMDLRFSDTDQVIEEQTGMTIPEIFRKYGEEHFRDLETQVLSKYLLLPKGSSTIISTGGGIVIRKENRELLRKLGFVVWLNADVQALFQRVSRSDNRPLLHNEKPMDTLYRLFDARKAFYEEAAHLSIDTTNLTVCEIAFGIMESARVFFNERSKA